MEITEVRVKLVEHSSERLRAFCSVTLDGDFVIRDLKVIDGVSGVFVAMPSRKLADRCNKCGSKNHLRARFCNECGQRLNENRAPKDTDGRAKLHADIAHPINAECRERIQAAVVRAYEEELERAKSPDYRPVSFDDYDDDYEDQSEVVQVARQPAAEEEGAERLRSSQDSAPPRRDRSEEHGRDRGGARSRERGGRKDRRSDQQESPEKSGNTAGSFGDYNELIADLKREAATRQDDRQSYRGRFDRNERQDAAAHHTEQSVPEPQEAASEPVGDEHSDFGTGIESDDTRRRDQNHRRPRQEETARREQRDSRKAPAAQEPEKKQTPTPEPEPARVESEESRSQEDDDFGAGLL